MKFLKIFLVVSIALLIIVRLLMPHYLLKYVVAQINSIPDYYVKIGDLDISLYSGAYTIKNIQLWKKGAKLPVPFYEAESIKFAVDWNALTQGKFLAKISTQKPKVNFITDGSSKDQQVGISTQWLDVVKNLYPLNINRFDAHKAEISFSSLKGNPPFKILVNDAELTIQNMQNATQDAKLLTSSFSFKGKVIGGGNILLNGKFDPFKKQPTFKIDGKLTNLPVANVANFLKHYSMVDAKGGKFSMFIETAAANGHIKGYIKPFIKDLKIGGPKNGNPLEAVVDAAASLVAAVVENSQQKTVATQINIAGSIDEPDTSILSIIGYLIRHGFIQALLPQVDHKVQMEDIYFGSKPPKSKFPAYRQHFQPGP